MPVATAPVVAKPNAIHKIQLVDGWHTVENAELVEFAISPTTPDRTYTSIKYKDPMKPASPELVTPLRQVLSFELES